MQFENRQFSLLNPPAATQTPAHIPVKSRFFRAHLNDQTLSGARLRRFNLDNVDAVLHDLYHSGTACASPQWGENYSLLEFIKRCEKQGITVYLAPAIKSADAYQSTQALIEQGAKIIWNMSIEAAYVKLLLAYGNFDDEQEIMDFIDADIAGEHL